MILQLQPLLTAALSLLVQRAQLQQCSIQTTPTNYSPVLDSLQCYNDYTNHIRCTWEEDQQLSSNQPLIRIPNSDFGFQICIRENDSRVLPSGKIQHSCIRKTKVFFRGEHTFLFNASCPSQSTTLNLATHGKVQTPINLSERKINGGNRMLSWSSPYSPSSSLTSKLIYQLRYRRHGQDWTVVDTKNASELVIMKRDLLSGYSYSASVRARLATSLWSDWSPPVAWITEKENILNLQCVITEDGVICSWQVHRENAQFLSYHLCWNTSEIGQHNCSQCKQCTDHNHFRSSLLECTCSVESLEPELLSVEIRSVHIEKSFSFPHNIHLPQPSPVKVHKQDNSWTLSWSRPNVGEHLKLTYQVHVQSNGTQDHKEFSHTVSQFSLPASSLMPSTVYMVQVRAVPGEGFSGQASEWSKPTYFTSDPAPWMNALIYILTGLIVVVCFTILYNVLLACQRNLQEWDVSIPSPVKSKVIDQIIIKTSAGRANLYNEMGKTSPYIMQTSDNPIIYNGSISECPVLPCSDDIDMGLSVMKSGYFHSLSHFSSYSHDNTVTDKSGISFSGPYLICRQNSSVPTETSDMSSLSSFDEVGHLDSTGKDNTSPVKGGYVLSPPTILTSSKHQPTLDEPVTEHKEASQEALHVSHPTYTVNPIPCQIFSHPSGYCLMPNKDPSVSSSGFVSTPLAEGTPSWPSNEPELGNPFKCGYVTLSSRKKN